MVFQQDCIIISKSKIISVCQSSHQFDWKLIQKSLENSISFEIPYPSLILQTSEKKSQIQIWLESSNLFFEIQNNTVEFVSSSTPFYPSRFPTRRYATTTAK